MSAVADLPPLTEKAWMQQVIELAKTLGWRVYHPWLSVRSEPGFPDLTLLRERIVFAELKTDRGRVGIAQQEWREALRAAGGEAYIWRPSMWDEVVAVLSRRGE